MTSRFQKAVVSTSAYEASLWKTRPQGWIGSKIAPDGCLALDPHPDALREFPAHADIGRVDDVPTAGAVSLVEGADALRIHGERLVLGFPEKEHRRLEHIPAPEPRRNWADTEAPEGPGGD
eukprot:5925929-Alexandrium_andersonii.AAC.1